MTEPKNIERIIFSPACHRDKQYLDELKELSQRPALGALITYIVHDWLQHNYTRYKEFYS